jgi:hypothetical protein
MGDQSPSNLTQHTLAQCASIAGIQRDIFDPFLTTLVAGACRWDKQHRQTRADRAKIVRDTRVLATTLRKATPWARRPYELGLPYGTAWLDVIADATAPSSPRTRDAHWNAKFIILLCAFVQKAGGKLKLNEKGEDGNQGTLVELLDALKPHLPRGFLPTSPNTLRRLKERAAHLAAHTRQ